MIDLLVDSLTLNGGLENAIESAIMTEVLHSTSSHQQIPHQNLLSSQAIKEIQAKKIEQDSEQNDKVAQNSGSNEDSFPILTLVEQLLKTTSSISISRLKCLNAQQMISMNSFPEKDDSKRYAANSVGSTTIPALCQEKSSPTIALLIKFQRLLFHRLMHLQNEYRTDKKSDVAGKNYRFNNSFFRSFFIIILTCSFIHEFHRNNVRGRVTVK